MQKARSEILQKYRKAENEDEKHELLQQYYGVGRSFADRFMEVARKHPKDPDAVQALMLVLTNAGTSPQAAAAAEWIVKDHLGDQQVLGAIPQLAGSPAPAVQTVLRAVMGHAKQNDDQGKATFALAQSLKEQVGVVREVRGATADQLRELKGRWGEEGVKQFQAADPAKLEAEAEKLFEQVVEKYADVKQGRTTLGSQAKPELFELRHLAIGKKAPEIEAEDIDGVKFKLSDYRGKVVMLDFWGHW
jgi:hypothetical protein